MNVTGSIKRTTLLGPFDFPDYGVTGTGAAYGDGAVWMRQTTSNDPAMIVPGEAFVAYFQNRIAYGRNGSAARPSNANPSCGNLNIPDDPDCLAFSAASATQLTYTAVDVDLAGAADVTSTPSHGLVRFDIAPAQGQIEGLSLWVDAAEWMWVPDDPANGPAVTVGCSGYRHCELFVDVSGTMYSRAYVNGKMHEAPGMHVTVTDELQLTVDKPWGPQNYLAHFKVRNSDGTEVLVDSWYFVPDSGAAFFAWCPTWAQSSEWNCAMNVPSSGTMYVKVSVHYNHWAYKSVRVTVIKCPTGDSLLDNPEFKKKMKALWDSSNALDPNQSNRTERIGAIIDSAGQRKFVIFSAHPANTPCSVTAGPPSGGENTAGWRVAAVFHIHPFADSTIFTDPSCPGGGNGVTAYVLGPTTGWASGFDWHTSQNVGAPSYIIDFNRITRIRGDSAQVIPRLDPAGNVMQDEYDVPNWRSFTTIFKRNASCSLLVAQGPGPDTKAIGVPRRIGTTDTRIASVGKIENRLPQFVKIGMLVINRLPPQAIQES